MDSSDTPRAKKKKNTQSPESKFHSDLMDCSKKKDLPCAILLYESALSNNLNFNQKNFDTLLYLCSISVADPLLKDLAITSGFRIFDHLKSAGFAPNERMITGVARLAAARGDGNYAFELVKSMGMYVARPKLRSYDPALFCFCEKLEAVRAYEVEQHMASEGVGLEEPQFAALLKMSSETGNRDRVYSYLHKLRSSVSCVAEATAKAIEEWFCSEKASGVVAQNLELGVIREAISRNGGGWHGKGWIGKGNWAVKRTKIDSCGKCCCCGEKLVAVDIDCAVTEKFVESMAAFAIEREIESNFKDFQNWLEVHSDYDAIVDGANIGFYQQNFADGGFSLSQLEAIVKELHKSSGGKWPLIFLHNKHVRALLGDYSHRKLVEEWQNRGILYTTPKGSNDDWYWLYAAVKLKCLLVTNDEMRDHKFELLGSLLLRWKAKHQVHYTFVKGNPKLQMPLLYTTVIQESERGSWHVPIAGDAPESERAWLCVTRPSCLDSSRLSEEETVATTHKRKERSPSPS